ncbi:beta-lactamase superfamily domain-containing protein [Pilaira anomala]|nr:beta-lactamase superfamily domain-containing protein [Pilaira anomala]
MFRRFATTALFTTVLMSKTVHAQGTKKEHHDGTGFKNPWPSFTSYGFFDAFKMFLGSDKSVLKAARPIDKPEKVDINWNLLKQKDNQLHATWLGHACIFLQMKRFNILLDPVFSDRCSPVQFTGPKRYTDPPCKLEELPSIDAVIISHNHYDHLDVATIKKLSTLHPDCKFYVPLGNKSWFNLSEPFDSQGNDRVIELDWWESANITNETGELKFTCTPCQHFSGRGLLDRNKTLWASWCIENAKDGTGKVFFGGDTGYRTIPIDTKPELQYDVDYLDTLPHCPAFKEIGEKMGPFDLALIPIGAYSPRWFMSPIHCSPEDAVELHRDIKSKHSIGIHWGTFVLTDEPLFEPPKRLKAAMEKRGLDGQDFNVLPLGGTHSITI